MIPGLGPVLAAGPVVGWIVAGLEGAVEVGALGAVGGELFSIGISKNSIVKSTMARTFKSASGLKISRQEMLWN